MKKKYRCKITHVSAGVLLLWMSAATSFGTEEEDSRLSTIKIEPVLDPIIEVERPEPDRNTFECHEKVVILTQLTGQQPHSEYSDHVPFTERPDRLHIGPVVEKMEMRFSFSLSYTEGVKFFWEIINIQLKSGRAAGSTANPFNLFADDEEWVIL